jgi:hypothetical protein
MKPQIQQLKTQLREFIELSKTITQGKWEVTAGVYDCSTEAMQFPEGPSIRLFGKDDILFNLGQENNATFIARSRNLSPTMAECLLVALQGLEDNLLATELYEGHGGDAKTQSLLQQILALWEASK